MRQFSNKCRTTSRETSPDITMRNSTIATPTKNKFMPWLRLIKKRLKKNTAAIFCFLKFKNQQYTNKTILKRPTFSSARKYHTLPSALRKDNSS
uniref:Uncharacterized protein n=1 Tax=Ixodes ricinus TaxID=34613 RepID=A0A131Y8Q8_IXORI